MPLDNAFLQSSSRYSNGWKGRYVSHCSVCCLCAVCFLLHRVVYLSSARRLAATYLLLFPLCGHSFLIYNGTNYNSAYIGNLDYPGTAFLVFAVSLSLLYRARMGWKKFVFLSVSIALVMLHVVSFLKPFMVFVPCMVFYAALTQISRPSGKSYMYAAFLAGFLSVVFFALSEISSSMPHQKKYPAQHMLMSDLKIASILADEPDYLQHVLMPKIHNELRTASSSFPYGKYEFIGHNLIITKKPISNDHEWHALCRAYLDYTIRHPKDMLEARLIKTLQFFTGNHVPMAVRKLIEWEHPHAKTSGLTYNFFYWPENVGSFMGNVRRHLCTMIMACRFCPSLGLCLEASEAAFVTKLDLFCPTRVVHGVVQSVGNACLCMYCRCNDRFSLPYTGGGLGGHEFGDVV